MKKAHDFSMAEVKWAVEQWQQEVANRPMHNVHRRTLDNTWRQVIRRHGGDDVSLCGPKHDDLLTTSRPPEKTSQMEKLEEASNAIAELLYRIAGHRSGVKAAIKKYQSALKKAKTLMSCK
jgi:hypothetical protein